MRYEYHIIIMCCLIAIAIPGCDPGYTYSAMGPRSPIGAWSKTIDGVTIHGEAFSTLGGLSAAPYIVAVRNDSGKQVVVISSHMITNERTMSATFPDPASRTFAPGETGEIYTLYEYGKHECASDILGRTIQWRWHLSIGQEIRVFEITMERS